MGGDAHPVSDLTTGDRRRRRYAALRLVRRRSQNQRPVRERRALGRANSLRDRVLTINTTPASPMQLRGKQLRRRRFSRTAVLVWFGLGVGLLFAYLAIRDTRPAEVWDALSGSNYRWLVPALVALAVANVLRACRWRYLFVHDTRPPLASVLKAMLIGQFFNNILPVRAGEAARVVALNRSSRTSRAEALGTVVAERALDVLCLLLLLFVLLPWLPHVSWLGAAAILAAAVSAGLLAAIAVLALAGARALYLPLRMLARLRLVSRERAERASANFVQGMAALQRPRLAVGALFWTLVSWGVLGVSAWFVTRSFDLGLSPVAGMLVMIAIGLAMILPAPPAAVGVFEAAVVVALSAYDVPNAQALSYALVLHALNFFPYLAAGLVVLQSHVLTFRRASAG
jgi:uncharacterized protein (TIRG00374 family)